MVACLSRTGEMVQDLDVLIGRQADSNLRYRTPEDKLDVQHETTDQKLGLESLLARQSFPVRLPGVRDG
jgi:hypothetical protein